MNRGEGLVEANAEPAVAGPARANEPPGRPPAAPGAQPPAALAPASSAIFLSEGEQIRLGIGLLGIVWFAFFFVADARIPHAEHEAEVAYLVASASLGLVWSGPLTVLAGMRLYPRTFTLWQPFYGGFVFVLLQAFGWLLYAGSLMCCLLTLANLSSGHWHRGAHAEGGFVALGVLGLVAGIILNMSLDHFDESLSASAVARAAEAAVAAAAIAANGGAPGAAGAARPPSRPSAMQTLCNGKTLVALFLSSVGLLLFLACDAYRELLSPAALPIASLPFVGAAIVTQAINGPSQLRGFCAFQPFSGGMSFVLLQAFGWFSFGGVVQMVLLVPTDRLGEISGLIPMCGVAGFASQLILISSLPHHECSRRAPAVRDAARRGGWRNALAQRIPPSEAFLPFCFYCWSAVTFVGALALERGAVERAPVPVDTRGLLRVSTLLLAVATPSAHLAGKRLHEAGGYRAWQPFCGGTMYCVAQGFGWLLYALYVLLLLISARRVPRAPASCASQTLVFFAGSLAYAMVAFSLEQYDARCAAGPPAPACGDADADGAACASDGGAQDETRALGGAARAGSGSGAFAPAADARPGSRSLAWTGETCASVTMTVVSLCTCAGLDAGISSQLPACVQRSASRWLAPFDPDDIVALAVLMLASVTLLFAMSAALVHVGASRRLRNYRLWMPFHGDDGFVVRQALGWTLFAMSQVLLWMLVLTLRTERVAAHGVVFGAGAVAAVSQYLLLRSLDFFERGHVTVKLSGLADPALTVARLGEEIQLLQRLVSSADQPLVSRVLRSVLAQLEERAAEASAHGAAARPLNVLITPRAMQLVNLCLILVSTGSMLISDALRGTQPHVAQVLLATGVGLACYTVVFSHCFVGRLFHPSYRAFQPFTGSRYYVILQATGWALFGIALVASATILYAHVQNVTVDGVVATVGVVLFLAQLLVAISIFAYRPPPRAGAGADGGACAAGGVGAHHASGEWSAAGGRIQATHGQAIALLMSLSALLLFVIADLAPARLGADGVLIGVPTAPIIASALVALCGSVGVTYLISCTQMPCGLALHRPPHGAAGAGAGADGTVTPVRGSDDGTDAADATAPTHSPAFARTSPLALSPSAPDVTVIFAGRGRFLVPHIFGCALLSLTFLRAALAEVNRFEMHAHGQNTLTGLAGLASILLMLCSQSNARDAHVAQPRADALTIRVDALPGQLLAALVGARVDGRRDGARGRIARALAWRLALSLRPLSVAAALMATLAVRERAGGAPAGSTAHESAAGLLVELAANASAAGGLGHTRAGAHASSARAASCAVDGGAALACAVRPLLLAAARAAPPPVTLGAVTMRLWNASCSLGRALSPGRVVLLGALLTAAALLVRLVLSATQGARLQAADAQLSPAAVDTDDVHGARPAEPTAADPTMAAETPVVGLNATRLGTGAEQLSLGLSAAALASLARAELPMVCAHRLAAALRRLRGACAPAVGTGAGASASAREQMGARAVALLRALDAALDGVARASAVRARAESCPWRSGVRAPAQLVACADDDDDDGAPRARLSALELLPVEELQDTLGMHVPVEQLAVLSLCSRTLRARLPPAFWRARFVHEYGTALGLPPHAMIIPSLRPCSAVTRSPLGALAHSVERRVASLVRRARLLAACARQRSLPSPPPPPRPTPPPATLGAAAAGLSWRRACVLAGGGATLRYCIICSHVDLDLDAHAEATGSSVTSARSPARARSASFGGGSATSATARGACSAWIVLRACPAHGDADDTSEHDGDAAHPRAKSARALTNHTRTPATSAICAHRACVERAAAAREEAALGTRFECPRCAHPLPAARRPAQTWSELVAATGTAEGRRYARRNVLLSGVVLLALRALQVAVALAEQRAWRAPLAAWPADARGAVSALLSAAFGAMPRARALVFALHGGGLVELLVSRHAWRAVASARCASEHAQQLAIAAVICVCAGAEIAELSALRLRSLHPLLSLPVPPALARALAALCSAVFAAATDAVLLRAWCARTVVPTPLDAPCGRGCACDPPLGAVRDEQRA